MVDFGRCGGGGAAVDFNDNQLLSCLNAPGEHHPASATKSWKIENGILTVLPASQIVNGKWKKLPPEQAALGGDGDLVTNCVGTDPKFKNRLLKRR